MPYPSAAQTWFYQEFSSSNRYENVLPENPQDWSRLKYWDGTTLQDALPKGFSGTPSNEQIEELYAHVQQGRLFLFNLGNPNPSRLSDNKSVEVHPNPKEPVAPVPVGENATAEDIAQYSNKKAAYDGNYSIYLECMAVVNDCGENFWNAVDQYNAGRNMEQESVEASVRSANNTLMADRYNCNKADRVISTIMAPNPVAPLDVIFVPKREARTFTVDYDTYNQQVVANAYNLPANDRLTEDDAATINFAMLGSKADIHKYASKNLKKYGPIRAQLLTTDSYHMLITGMFGETRSDQPVAECMGEAMRLGKEAITKYLNGDPTLLGKRLAETVRNTKMLFTGVSQSKFTRDMVANTQLTARLLKLFDKNPDILQATGLKQKELDHMRGYVQMGRIMENFRESQMKLKEANTRGQQLSNEEKVQILADAVLRRFVESELVKDNKLIESSQAYIDGIAASAEKDIASSNKYDAFKNTANTRYKDNAKRAEALNAFVEKNDVNSHTLLFMQQDTDHQIMVSLGQPGMLERMREDLLKDPAIQAMANNLQNEEFDLVSGRELDTLIEQVRPTLENSQKEIWDVSLRSWFDSMKTTMSQGENPMWPNPNIPGDEARMMVVRPAEQGGKELVPLATLLEGGLQALQDPSPETVRMLHDIASKGNLYCYGVGKDLPQRISADGLRTETKQIEPPRKEPGFFRWALNRITFGYAFADDFNYKPDPDPEAVGLFMGVKDARSVAAQQELEARRAAANEQEREDNARNREQAEVKAPAVEEKKTRIMESHHPEAINNMFKRMTYNVQNMVPANCPLELTGEQIGVLVAMAMGCPDLAIPVATGKHKPKSVKKNPDDPNANVAAAKPKQEVEHYRLNEPDINFTDVVCGYFVQGNNMTVQGKGFKKSAERAVHRALQQATQGDFTQLGKLLADGLGQNNEVLMAQERLTDVFTAHAELAKKALQIMNSNTDLKNAVLARLGPNNKDIQIAKAARNISNLRVKAVPLKEDMVKEFSIYNKSAETKAKERENKNVELAGDRPVYYRSNPEVAMVCIISSIETAMVNKEFNLADTQYSNSKVINESIKAMEESAVLDNFRTNDLQRHLKLNDPVEMTLLYKEAILDNQRKAEMKKNDPNLEKQMQNQKEDPVQQAATN